jgi:hypothetical protein
MGCKIYCTNKCTFFFNPSQNVRYRNFCTAPIKRHLSLIQCQSHSNKKFIVTLRQSQVLELPSTLGERLRASSLGMRILESISLGMRILESIYGGNLTVPSSWSRRLHLVSLFILTTHPKYAIHYCTKELFPSGSCQQFGQPGLCWLLCNMTPDAIAARNL